MSSLASQNGATGGMTQNLQQVQFCEVVPAQHLRMQFTVKPTVIAPSGRPTAATASASDAAGSRGERRDHPKIGLYSLDVRAAQGATCARPRVWPESEERAFAGEAQLHRFVARSLQALLLRSRLLTKKAVPQTRPRRVPFSSYRHGLFLRECCIGRLLLRASGCDEWKVGYVGGVQRQLQCSGFRHLRHLHISRVVRTTHRNVQEGVSNPFASGGED